ncbi:MAG: hypothetical protein K5648_06320 [Erysipelotrichaceae bacterium]|nr:hypothetical protein [Erysipelotrichaceae bacterium]
MNTEKIKNALNEFISGKNRKLFDVEYKKSDHTLTVLLDEKLNMDELETLSNEISGFLDQYEDEFEDNYFLDVSTVGAERPIRNGDELKAAVGQYIYVKTKDNEYYGTLTSFNGDVLNLKVKEKTREKDVSIEYSKTKKVRYAVKF